jgi:regulator of sigma E protease
MLSNFFTDAGVVVVVLGVMIFVHELGHFAAAKWFGIRVLTFSFGLGKRLFGMKVGDTDYRVSLLPFGGYVKMAGEEPSENHQPDPTEFQGRPRWQRFVVVMMGPAMNILMAVVVLTAVFKFHFQRPVYEEQPARVGALDPDSPAAQAGLQAGDLIARIDGATNPDWEDLATKVMTSAGQALPLEVVRAGQRLELTLRPKAEGRDQIGYVGIVPYEPAVIEKVTPGLPAAQAGLLPGDEIVGYNGQRCYSYPAIFEALQLQKGSDVEIMIRRQEREFTVHVNPVYSQGAGGKIWRIGVEFPNDMVVRHLPLARAFAASIDYTVRNSLLTFDVLGKILTRHMSAKSLSGPIGIAQVSGAAYRAGFLELLMIVSFISLQLGIFNLLPIPILDGGTILLLAIESVIRRDLSLAFKERFVQVGMAFLLFLAVFVVYNDIMKTIRPF